MSEVIDQAVQAIAGRMQGQSFEGTAKFVLPGEGAIMLAGGEVRAGDEPADVTLTADTDTFRAILDGDTNPTAAFMTGKLPVDGDMGKALALAGILA